MLIYIGKQKQTNAIRRGKNDWIQLAKHESSRNVARNRQHKQNGHHFRNTHLSKMKEKGENL